MTKKQRELMALIEGGEPKVIYQLAREVGRPYRRVYDNIRKFAGMGLVTLEKVSVNNRAALKVISTNPAYQGLMRLDAMRSISLGLSASEREALPAMSYAIRRLSSLIGAHGVIVGGVCANLYGIDRAVERIQMAADMTPEQLLNRLSAEGVHASLNSNGGDLSGWKIRGDSCGVGFEIVDAGTACVNVVDGMDAIDIRIASEKDFIVNSCKSGGDADVQGVAALALMNRNLTWYAMSEAEKYGCRELLDAYMKEPQMLTRYGEAKSV